MITEAHQLLKLAQTSVAFAEKHSTFLVEGCLHHLDPEHMHPCVTYQPFDQPHVLAYFGRDGWSKYLNQSRTAWNVFKIVDGVKVEMMDLFQVRTLRPEGYSVDPVEFQINGVES